MSFLHPFRDRRRRMLAAQPFPADWAAIVRRNVPFVASLAPAERGRLEGLIKVFLAEKNFEGCGGMVITDEVRLTIAAQACLLLLNLHHDYFERLRSILVYPAGFYFDHTHAAEGGTVAESRAAALGLSSSGGAVVLSWRDTIEGSRDPADGHNVVLHEFAHQLDQLDGAMDGAPPLESGSRYRRWARVLDAEFRRLHAAMETNSPSLIRDYGATRPAEFFATVTEIFFEQPAELRHLHPELYAEFSGYYGQDPAARSVPPRA